MIIRYGVGGFLFIIMLFCFPFVAESQDKLGKINCICIDAGHGGKDPVGGGDLLEIGVGVHPAAEPQIGQLGQEITGRRAGVLHPVDVDGPGSKELKQNKTC